MDTITREDLLSVTRDTIDLTNNGLLLEPESLEWKTLKSRLLEVAAHVSHVTMGWWDTETKCGCLMGSIYGPDVMSLTSPLEYEVAINFAIALSRWESRNTKSWCFSRIYEVVDDEKEVAGI